MAQGFTFSDKPLWNLRLFMIMHQYHEKRRAFKFEQSAFYGWGMVVPRAGTFRYEMEGEAGEASFGDIVVCRPDTMWWRQINSSLTYHVFEFLWRDETSQFVNPRQMPMGKITLQDISHLQNNLLALQEMGSTGYSDDAPIRVLDEETNSWRESRATHLLQDILHLFYAQSLQMRQLARQSHNDQLMDEALRTLQKKAGEPLSMKVLARELGLTPVQFSRRFQQKFHTSPSDYLASLRMNMARNLLLETDLTIQEVAVRCGYQNGFYLSNVFSRKFKMSPGQFRKTHRAKL